MPDETPKDLNAKNPQAPAEKRTKKTARFFWLCTGLLGAIMAAFVLFSRFEIFDAGPHVVFAMFIGVALTILLGVGLMALAFHSDRSGIDDRF